MITINYQKRKNTELFKSVENKNLLYLSKTQNYIPIYNKFFSLNENNYNKINLNNKLYISDVNEKVDDNNNLFICTIKNIDESKPKQTKEVFFKMAPLLDPYKYLIGKYDINNDKLFNLPILESDINDCNPKLIDENNSAYVDGLFLFLLSQLKNNHKFIHGVEYYGSFLAIKNNFKINVFDDIDYLNNSEFFNKNKNTLFTIDNYEHLFQNKNRLKPIKIGNDISLRSNTSIKSIDNKIFDDIFDETNIIDFNCLKDSSFDLIDITNKNMSTTEKLTLKSNSTCSSRSSHTNDDDYDNECSNCDQDDVGYETVSDENNELENEDDDDDDDDDDNDDDDDDEDEETINVILPKFPVQIIGMEYCENTFDSLILDNELSHDEWFSALMQIIMILITYQKAFNFTHNDLHTNNIMYVKTNKKYIYYCYKKTYYKVPTYGRIFKIIDFGRSIFKFEGKLFCSDSFQIGGDAATQYNTEPYFNDKKPRLEPNYSFDLCRLACSIFDNIIDDFDEIRDSSKITDPVKKLIFEWCLDDKGINMLYKNNGSERYPDFKLYKMIARCVHNHTPNSQLERPEFKQYKFNPIKTEAKELENLMDIDGIPCYI
jgi:hypothetical protein